MLIHGVGILMPWNMLINAQAVSWQLIRISLTRKHFIQTFVIFMLKSNILFMVWQEVKKYSIFKDALFRLSWHRNDLYISSLLIYTRFNLEDKGFELKADRIICSWSRNKTVLKKTEHNVVQPITKYWSHRLSVYLAALLKSEFVSKTNQAKKFKKKIAFTYRL